MAELRPKTLQVVWLIIAAVLFGGASLLHKPIDRLSRQYELIPAGNASLAKHPELALLKVAPGGLRSLMINYLWMRSQSLHREGRHFDAMQLAELICTLQPQFPGVWQFQSWQLAWNISAAAHTPQERWHWVKRGIDLLRDRGIAMNPNALLLYKQLSWTFISKMGDNTDDMHQYYKAKWAQDMQHLLGAPPPEKTEGILAAFKTIADAPINRDAYDTRDSATPIQNNERRKFLRNNPKIAALADDLSKVGLKLDASLLKAYNFCTRSDTVNLTRSESVDYRDHRLRRAVEAIKDPAEKAAQLAELDRRAEWAKVINNPDHSEAMDQALAFVRAQILWNVHKMDPEYMYKLMRKFGPIDWRLAWSHGLYWSAYGVEHCKDVSRKHIDWLNTDRTLLTCLKKLAWQGKLIYRAAPENLQSEELIPNVHFRSDWRFIESTHLEYTRLGTEHARIRKEAFEKNPLDAGHVNFLGNAVSALYVRGRRPEAKKYFDWVRKHYKKTDDRIWGSDNVDAFVIASLTAQENLIPRVALAQLTAALQTAMVWVARGDDTASDGHISYAKRLHTEYHKSFAMKSKRLRLPKLEEMAAAVFEDLLMHPKLLDFDLSLAQRSVMYKAMEHRWPEMVAYVYDRIHRYLQHKCKIEKLDFDTLFPEPRALESIRQRRAVQPQQQP
ncbi:MAG: hypothetical protein QGG42_18470 [Phycisphaerae bacterium]|jgi:hypothetical protein|nr:hypothetical protein [Phycisphaerae bacterium]